VEQLHRIRAVVLRFFFFSKKTASSLTGAGIAGLHQKTCGSGKHAAPARKNLVHMSLAGYHFFF